MIYCLAKILLENNKIAIGEVIILVVDFILYLKIIFITLFIPWELHRNFLADTITGDETRNHPKTS
jgi:hypothetical protein